MKRDRGDSRKSITGDPGEIGPSHTGDVGAEAAVAQTLPLFWPFGVPPATASNRRRACDCGTASVAVEAVVIRAVDGSEVLVLMGRRELGREWEEKVANDGDDRLGTGRARGQAGK